MPTEKDNHVHCPHCGSMEVVKNKKHNEFECDTCGNVFSEEPYTSND